MVYVFVYTNNKKVRGRGYKQRPTTVTSTSNSTSQIPAHTKHGPPAPQYILPEPKFARWGKINK